MSFVCFCLFVCLFVCKVPIYLSLKDWGSAGKSLDGTVSHDVPADPRSRHRFELAIGIHVKGKKRMNTRDHHAQPLPWRSSNSASRA